MIGLHLHSSTEADSQAATHVASALSSKQHATPKSVQAKDDSGTNANQNATTSTSDITSSDFLSLLVSELKNQDPTQPTDPNAYITQLVGVNSLQQLIQINSGLTTLEAPFTDSTGS